MIKPSVEDLQVALQSHIVFVNEAIDNLRADRLVTIGTLENDIDKICRAVKSLPPEDATRLESAMAQMIGCLESFALELQSFQERHGHH